MAATVLAEQVIDGASGPPYAFSLSYDPATIVDTGRYPVRAQIKDGDRLLFTEIARKAQELQPWDRRASPA